MYIATNEISDNVQSIFGIMPTEIRRHMYGKIAENAEEIRIITGKPIIIRRNNKNYYLTSGAELSDKADNSLRVTRKMMDELTERISKSSIYSVKEELKNGYVTIDGGHRVGIAGTAVTENGETEFINNISAMNIRIAREIIGVSDKLMKFICTDEPKNTLIISQPGGGKTTLLRDIARNVSHKGYNVAIADERSEIAAVFDGQSPFDLGDTTAVMDNCPKDKAMLMLLRSMSPEVIITDEIGTERDAAAVMNIINSGVCVMASVHGSGAEQIRRKKNFREIFELFEVIVTLSKRNGTGTVEEVIKQ